MTKSEELANRLEEVFISGKWIANTNYKEQITSINFFEAIYSVKNLNSIALLTFHINYYLDGILTVFNGGTLNIKDKFSFDMPEIKSEEDWQHLISTFLSNANKFIEKVRQMPDDLLNNVFEKEIYGSYSRNIEGVIEHSYYHLGQIVLLKKMINDIN